MRLITSPVGDLRENDILSHPGYHMYTLKESAFLPTRTSIGTTSPVFCTTPWVWCRALLSLPTPVVMAVPGEFERKVI